MSEKSFTEALNNLQNTASQIGRQTTTLEEALKHDGPVWIDCVIDRNYRVLPMIPAGSTVNDTIFD